MPFPLMIRFNSAGGLNAPRNLGIAGTVFDVLIGSDDDITRPSPELQSRLRRATGSDWNRKVIVYGHSGRRDESSPFGTHISDRHRKRTGGELARFIDQEVYGQSNEQRRVKILSCYTGRTDGGAVLLDDVSDEFSSAGKPYRVAAARTGVSASKPESDEKGIKFIWRRKAERAPTLTTYRVGDGKIDNLDPRRARTWAARRADKERVLRTREGLSAPEMTAHETAQELGDSGQGLPSLAGSGRPSVVAQAGEARVGDSLAASTVSQTAEELERSSPKLPSLNACGSVVGKLESVAEDVAEAF